MNSSSSANCTDVLDLTRDTDLTQTIWSKATFGVLYTCVFIVSIITNLCIVFGVCFRKGLQTVRNFYVANLAIADLLTTIACLPISAYSFVYKEWVFGATFCHLVPFVQALTVLVSTFCLVLVAVDRYWLLVKNFSTSNKQALFALLVVWVLATVCAAPLLIFTDLVTGEYFMEHDDFPVLLCGQFCTETLPTNIRVGYSFGLVFVQYFAPLTIISLCYYRTSRRLNRNAENIRRNSSSVVPFLLRQSTTRACRVARRINRVLVLIVASFCMCWLPQITLNFIRDLTSAKLIELPQFLDEHAYITSIVFHWLSMVSCPLNALLYLWTNDQFHFWKLIKRKDNESGTPRSYVKRLTKVMLVNVKVSVELSANP